MQMIPRKRRQNESGTREMTAPSTLTELRKQMDRLFDRFLREPWEMSEGMRTMSLMPTIDVSETDNEILIRAELPGIDSKDVDITVSGNILTISGEKKDTTEQKGENFYHTERRFGSFRRSIELPGTADTDSIEAEEENGVLTVHVKRQAGAAPRHVDVKPRAGERRPVAART